MKSENEMIGGVLMEGASVVVEVKGLVGLDGFAGVKKEAHSALVTETQGFYVLELGFAVDALVFVVDAQEETRNVAVLLGHDVQTFR